ncbi:conjugative transfer system coupling protein TraD [Providencia sp. M-27]|uniref:conjugative transfer system coupling protein TraD n=1 Tax=Providencia sp. M-27 TaxID=2713150 RepID=UPI00140C02D6|nr:conjugative transfer system coupling protein TraD [Providencia sp. M-27]
MSDWKHLMPFRTNYEMYEVCGWGTGVLATVGVGTYLSMPLTATLSAAAIQSIFAMKSLPNAIKIAVLHKNLKTRPAPTFTSAYDVVKEMMSNRDTTLIGKGFTWRHEHGQRAYEILKSGVADRFLPNDHESMGHGWIHKLGNSNEWISVHDDLMTLHTSLTGTTGSGKTTLYKLLILQAALKRQPLILIDPKNDEELADYMYKCMKLMEREDDFYYLSIAHLDKSNRISPISNYSNSTEVASRIISVIQKADNTTDPFISFATMTLTTIVQLMNFANVKPTLVNIKAQLGTNLGNFAELLVKAIDKLGYELFPDVYDSLLDRRLEHQSMTRTTGTIENHAGIRITIYLNDIAKIKEYTFIKSGIDLFQHNREHFQKMILTALPVLSMLTSDGLDEVLSPSSENIDDERVITNMKDIINTNGMMYLGLNSLADGDKGNAVGSIFLSDITAVAADIYNYAKPRGEKKRDTNILIDEAAEVINDQVIRLQNKGRGAGFKLFIASQSTTDYVATLGSEAKKEQVSINANHNIALRTINIQGQKDLIERIPTTNFKYIQRGHGTSSGEDPEKITGSIGERLMEVESELFPPQLLGNLPNLEFCAILKAGNICKGQIPIVQLPTSEKEVLKLKMLIKEFNKAR